MQGARLTSVSLRADSFKKLKFAQRTLVARMVYQSEQEIFRGLLFLYLQKWRGVGSRTSRLRRYNLKGRGYVIKPLYLELGFSAALWTRAVHSGVSISRMLDFAIRHFLFVYVDQQLNSSEVISSCTLSIQYQCKTGKNSGQQLQYTQEVACFLPQAMPP